MKTKILLFIILLTAPALAQWTPAVRISEQATSFGPRIAANGDTLHVVYWIWNGHAESYYLKSADRGDTWSEPFRLGDTLISTGEDSPIIRIEGDTLNSIWWQGLPGGHYNYAFRRSLDGGESWADVIYILPSNSYELHSHAFSISDSKVFLIYNRTSNQEKAVEFTKSTNWGETWTPPAEIFRTLQTGQFDMVARDDTIHVVWTGRFTDEYPIWETYYLKSEDGGDNWTENISLGTVDDRGSMYPSVAINERGDLAVCWVDFKYSPYWWTGDLFVRYSYDAGESWTEEEQIIFTHTAESSRILWQGDSLHITWEDPRNGGADPYYIASYDNGFTWEEEQRIDNDQYNSHTPDLAVSGQKVHVVWDDRRQYDQGRGIYYSCLDQEVGIDKYTQILPTKIGIRAYPNPFNGTTTITYNLSEGGEIEIYSITGQKIRTLNFPTKEGKIIWDARDALGNKVSSGIYFARVRNGSVWTRAPQNSNTLKLLYLK